MATLQDGIEAIRKLITDRQAELDSTTVHWTRDQDRRDRANSELVGLSEALEILEELEPESSTSGLVGQP